MQGVVARRTARHFGFDYDVLSGPARTAWQHHVPPTKALRYSITFRTLRNPEKWLGSER